MSSAALPTLARLQSDPKAFNNAYARMISLCCLAACPVAFGFAAISQDAVPLIFGERWMPAVPAIQMLALLSPATEKENIGKLAQATGWEALAVSR